MSAAGCFERFTETVIGQKQFGMKANRIKIIRRNFKRAIERSLGLGVIAKISCLARLLHVG